jgi:hypothetical protein
MRITIALAAAATAVSLALLCTDHALAQAQGLQTTALFGTAVPDVVMAAQRGKAVLTIMDLNGSVQDNAAINNITGHNVIRGGSFTNASGLTTTIQNSGNNVLIQNATILQLDVR